VITVYAPNGAPDQRWRIKMVSPQKYTFMNVNSGKFLDISGGYSGDGAWLLQYNYTGNSNQLWSFTPTGTGFYKFSPGSTATGSLDVSEASTADGAQILQWTWYGGLNQQWSIVPAK
jgi:hypothetical protein